MGKTRKSRPACFIRNDPKARLEFIWRDEKARRRPTVIRAKDQSAWSSANGIRIGTALAESKR